MKKRFARMIAIVCILFIVMIGFTGVAAASAHRTSLRTAISAVTLRTRLVDMPVPYGMKDDPIPYGMMRDEPIPYGLPTVLAD